MADIRASELVLVEEIFEMEQGYVLNFSDRSFGMFFQTELKMNIDDPRFALNGRSKANRLRTFLAGAPNPLAVHALQSLWEYREAVRMRAKLEDTVPSAKTRLGEIIHRLGGAKPAAQAEPPKPAQPKCIDTARLAKLSEHLLVLSKLEPRARGYEFERFLKDLFDAHGLQGRDPFRIRGEQIDGSFVLEGEVYLLEAKWQSLPIGAAPLYAFDGKLQNKAAWTRGLFISQSSFTEDGLHAFGKGKRVLCMDGLDLYDTLSRGLPLVDVLNAKVRRFGESGMPLARVRDLFPH